MSEHEKNIFLLHVLILLHVYCISAAEFAYFIAILEDMIHQLIRMQGISD